MATPLLADKTDWSPLLDPEDTQHSSPTNLVELHSFQSKTYTPGTSDCQPWGCAAWDHPVHGLAGSHQSRARAHISTSTASGCHKGTARFTSTDVSWKRCWSLRRVTDHWMARNRASTTCQWQIGVFNTVMNLCSKHRPGWVRYSG